MIIITHTHCVYCTSYFLTSYFNYYLHLFFVISHLFGYIPQVNRFVTGDMIMIWYERWILDRLSCWAQEHLVNLCSITTFWESVWCHYVYETELYSFDCTLTCFLWADHYFLFLSLVPPGHTGRFIKVVFCTSLLFVLAHICFQTVLYTYPPLNIVIGDNCSQWDTITRHIGLSRYVTIVCLVKWGMPHHCHWWLDADWEKKG